MRLATNDAKIEWIKRNKTKFKDLDKLALGMVRAGLYSPETSISDVILFIRKTAFGEKPKNEFRLADK